MLHRLPRQRCRLAVGVPGPAGAVDQPGPDRVG